MIYSRHTFWLRRKESELYRSPCSLDSFVWLRSSWPQRLKCSSRGQENERAVVPVKLKFKLAAGLNPWGGGHARSGRLRSLSLSLSSIVKKWLRFPFASTLSSLFSFFFFFVLLFARFLAEFRNSSYLKLSKKRALSL